VESSIWLSRADRPRLVVGAEGRRPLVVDAEGQPLLRRQGRRNHQN
jgi:hypothetical protein